MIVPVYKAQQSLSRCVDSILQQTHQNFQLILIDDGSPDNSGAICDEYARKDPRILVVHIPNGGLSDARNAGIDASHGDWLMFVDGDDTIAPTMAQVLLENAKKHSAEMAIGSVALYRDTDQGRIVRDDLMSVEDNVYSGRDILKLAGVSGVIPPVYVIACNKLYRRSLFKALRYPKGVLHEDEAVIHYLLAECSTVTTVAQTVYYYRQVSDSIMNTTYSIRRLDAFQAYADRICFYEAIGLQECLPRMQDRFFWEVIEKYYIFKPTAENRAALSKCRTAIGRVLKLYRKRQDVPIKLKIAMAIFRCFPTVYQLIWKK